MELLVGLACVLLILVPVLLLQAMVLRWACTICGVEPPDYGWAILILFVNGIVTNIVQFGIYFVYAGGDLQRLQHDPQGGAIPLLISLPVLLILSLGIYSSMLGTTMGRAFLVLIVNTLIYILMCCVPILIMAGVGQLPVK